MPAPITAMSTSSSSRAATVGRNSVSQKGSVCTPRCYASAGRSTRGYEPGLLDPRLGGRCDPLVSCRVRMVPVVREVVRLVISVVGAFERGSEVDVGRAALCGGRLDHCVDLVRHLLR